MFKTNIPMSTYKSTKIIGERLKQARNDAGFTLEEVAEKIDKKQYQTVSKYESENAIPSFDVVLKLCNLYGCEVEYILGLIDKKTKSKFDSCDVTGLSEPAIDRLIRWKRSGFSNFGSDFISKMIEDDKLIFELVRAGNAYTNIKHDDKKNTNDILESGDGCVLLQKENAIKFLSYEISRLITQFAYKYFDISEGEENATK